MKTQASITKIKGLVKRERERREERELMTRDTIRMPVPWIMHETEFEGRCRRKGDKELQA
jgi:hypothetical protein